MHSYKQGIPVHKVALLLRFLWLNSHMWQKVAAKWECKTPEVFHGDISISACGQNNNIFCFQRVGVYIFTVLATWRLTNPSNAKDKRRTVVTALHPAHTLFLCLLGDHVARRSDRTAAVGLLLLGRFQDLFVEYRKKYEGEYVIINRLSLASLIRNHHLI